MAVPGPGDPVKSPAQALFDADEASRGAGITIVALSPGGASVAMSVTPGMLNGHGSCHGGYVFLLADTAFGLACNSHGESVVAAGADVAFLAPVRAGDQLVAVAVERARVGRSGLYDVTVRRGSQVVAEFRGRSRTVPDRPVPDRPDRTVPDRPDRPVSARPDHATQRRDLP